MQLWSSLFWDVTQRNIPEERRPTGKRAAADICLRVKTHTYSGAGRPAAYDLIRGNTAVDLFARVKSQAAGRSAPLYVCVCVYP